MADSDLPNPRISIVIPFFDEEAAAPALIAELRPVVERLGTAEVLLINDGSRDGTARVLDEAAAAWPAVRVFHFAKNHGQGAALFLESSARAARSSPCSMATGRTTPPTSPRSSPRWMARTMSRASAQTGAIPSCAARCRGWRTQCGRGCCATVCATRAAGCAFSGAKCARRWSRCARSFIHPRDGVRGGIVRLFKDVAALEKAMAARPAAYGLARSSDVPRNFPRDRWRVPATSGDFVLLGRSRVTPSLPAAIP